MRLSKRIYAIRDQVEKGESAADIGTDHGYVPMLLMRDGISPYVIMSDISEGSLAKARETFSITGISMPETAFRVGDGLETIEKSEVDDVIIAGLGGFTIIDILDADTEKSRSFHKLILQPRKYSGNLRYYLYTHGWDIKKETLAEEGKFVCEILTAEYSGEERREPPYPEEDIRWKYPAEMAKASPELAAKRIEWKIGSIREQLDNLSRSESDHNELESRLREDLAYLTRITQQ